MYFSPAVIALAASLITVNAFPSGYESLMERDLVQSEHNVDFQARDVEDAYQSGDLVSRDAEADLEDFEDLQARDWAQPSNYGYLSGGQVYHYPHQRRDIDGQFLELNAREPVVRSSNPAHDLAKPRPKNPHIKIAKKRRDLDDLSFRLNTREPVVRPLSSPSNLNKPKKPSGKPKPLIDINDMKPPITLAKKKRDLEDQHSELYARSPITTATSSLINPSKPSKPRKKGQPLPKPSTLLVAKKRRDLDDQYPELDAREPVVQSLAAQFDLNKPRKPSSRPKSFSEMSSLKIAKRRRDLDALVSELYSREAASTSSSSKTNKFPINQSLLNKWNSDPKRFMAIGRRDLDDASSELYSREAAASTSGSTPKHFPYKLPKMPKQDFAVIGRRDDSGLSFADILDARDALPYSDNVHSHYYAQQESAPAATSAEQVAPTSAPASLPAKFRSKVRLPHKAAGSGQVDHYATSPTTGLTRRGVDLTKVDYDVGYKVGAIMKEIMGKTNSKASQGAQAHSHADGAYASSGYGYSGASSASASTGHY